MVLLSILFCNLVKSVGMRYLCSLLLGQFSRMMADRHLRHTSVLRNAARCVLSGLYGQMKSSVRVEKGRKRLLQNAAQGKYVVVASPGRYESHASVCQREV